MVKPKLPTRYYINAEDGLELPSIILLEMSSASCSRRPLCLLLLFYRFCLAFMSEIKSEVP